MKKIGIAGAGGIGSNVAVHLVRSGVKNLKIIDFDEIDNSNLNRQFYFHDQINQTKVHALEENLKRINTSLELQIINQKITEHNVKNIFDDCDIIVEGFDRAELKAMLVNQFANTEKRIISASGLAGLDIESITTKDIGKNITIVGDFNSDIEDKKLYSPKIFVVCSLMANIILKELGFKDE